MTTLEQVEKLRERADVSFEEAKKALEEAQGDLLDALIILERQGKTAPPPSGGYYSEKIDEEPKSEKGDKKAKKESGSAKDAKNALAALGEFLLKLINIGTENYIDAIHKEKTVFSCPVIVLIALLVMFFWGVVPLIFISLFFGWKYRFRGPNLGKEAINNAISDAETAVSEFKTSVAETSKKEDEEIPKE